MSYIGKQPRKAALTSSDIEDGIITAAKIEDGAVVAAEIASNAVTTAKINADAVTAAKIADDVINSEHIAADSIDAEHYAAGSVDTTALGADAVTGAKIADDAINSEHYTDGSIDTAHIADVNVTQGKIADQAINEAKMQISNAPTNSYMLTAQSGNTGGMTWAAAPTGITVAEQWRVNTSFNGDANPIASNWEINDSDAPGTIGGGVISQSSGIFSFDRTGLYLINFFTTQVGNGGDDLFINAQVQVSIDNGSNWSSPTENSSNIGNPGSGVMYTGTSQTALVNVASVSGGNTRKVRFIVQTANDATTTLAYTAATTTGVNFIRLGEAA